MIKKLTFLFSVSLILAACTKSSSNSRCGYYDSGVTAPAAEIAKLQAWVNANHPAAIKDSSGVFYEITSAGTGGTANICSHVIIKYSGYLIFTSPLFKFDESLTPVTLTLGTLIIGWQKGLKLIQAGGSINLYIPPTLGYGASGSGNIPANSYLLFNIQLVGVS